MSKFEDKFIKAEAENRLTSVKEGQIRKVFGISLLAIEIVACILYPSFRTAYGPLSLVAVVAVGVWRTGNESL
jgi:hypothetical protein